MARRAAHAAPSRGFHRSRMWSGHRAVQGLVALFVAAVPFVVAIPSAFAGVGFSVSPTFPTSVTVGQSSLPATLQVSNFSTAPENAGNVTVNQINLVPACGTSASTGAGDCPPASADPGVFQVSATAVGEAGTACAGQTFTVSVVDPATGQVSFTPSGPPVVLTPPGTPSSICRIDFLLSVLKMPTHPAASPAPNTLQTDQIGFAFGTSTLNNNPGSGSGSSATNVAKAQPGLATTATATARVGSPISDTATLSAANPPGPPPTGTITFSLFGPNNATCTGTSAFTATVPVSSGPGNYTSPVFTPTTPGTYRWVASYSGDANNAAATTACADANETSTVSPATPGIVTTASPSVVIGGPISDSAVLSGGFFPTGTITFTLYGPFNATCIGPPAFTSTVVVSGNGTYPSSPFTPTAAGSFNWVASYSGDANNAAVTSACGVPGETSTVNKANPSLATTASPSVRSGGQVSDSAVLSGGAAPTGTVIFKLFGPGNPTCTGTPAFTSTKAIGGNGVYASDLFTTTTAGTYNWVASYSGDANNAGVSGACGAANESVTVTRAIATPDDFDGDGKSDIAVFRPSSGTWFIRPSGGGTDIVPYGASGDIPVAGDYNGDGKTDIAVFRPSSGTWFIHPSGGGMDIVVPWGASGDIPVPGDYNGDGRADLAVFRPSTGNWHIMLSGGGTTATNFGTNGDIPVPGDYNGDGTTDLAVFRPSTGTWFVLLTSTSGTFTYLGTAGDIPAPGDFNGDGSIDVAVFRPSTGKWYIDPSGGGATTVTSWGAPGDIPVEKPPGS
ncbi:MAG: VCBS repeat-containing protein [Actinomycetota bacterium]|nr:VCBS repeat-containing protein [Actinomycetota bacterium]